MLTWHCLENNDIFIINTTLFLILEIYKFSEIVFPTGATAFLRPRPAGR